MVEEGGKSSSCRPDNEKHTICQDYTHGKDHSSIRYSPNVPKISCAVPFIFILTCMYSRSVGYDKDGLLSNLASV